jgi:glycosyltransferase involved in cell wall biosynthesis
MKDSKPLVSIIIPAYNRADLIRETLDSIVAQKYENWECIVVDDGSSDNTREVVAAYTEKDDRFLLFDRPDDYLPGANGARNYGLDISKGEYIQWFDSDDLMLDTFLSSKMDIFNQHPEYDFIISRFTSFSDDKIHETQFRFRPKFEYLYENTLTDKIRTWIPSIIFKKDFLAKSEEKFNETLKWAQEVEFFSRLFIKYEYQYYILDESHCHVRRDNEDAITTSFDTGLSLELRESEFEANESTIHLLIEEDKLTDNLLNYLFRDQKKIITQSLKNSQDQIAEKYKKLIEYYLSAKKKSSRLRKFKIGYKLHKQFPIDNLFLKYREGAVTKYANWVARKTGRIMFEKGYLQSKINNKT